MSVTEGGQDLVIAGFWPRIGAFVVDVIILGLVGMVIGGLMYSSLASIGAPARLIGFFISLVYFGVLNSRIGNGQTLANRWFGLRVVDAQGEPLSLQRAFLRYTVLGVPYFFNNLPLSATTMMSPVVIGLLSLVVGGAGFALVYLYVFNRRSRQSLHDLVVGSYVVRVQPEATRADFPPIWRGHLVVIAVVTLLSLGAPAVVNRLVRTDLFAGLMPLYQTLETQPHVMNAGVTRGWAASTGHPTTHYLSAQLRVDAPITDDAGYARDIAQVLAKGDPHFSEEDVVTVGLSYGYDIGIASWWTRRAYSFKRGELQ